MHFFKKIINSRFGGKDDDVSLLQDVTEHRLLVFKDQGVLPPERHLEVSRWFGELESTFFDHPKSPHRDIFRVSNDRNEGYTIFPYSSSLSKV